MAWVIWEICHFNPASSSVTGFNCPLVVSARLIRVAFSVSKAVFSASKAALIFSSSSKEDCRLVSALAHRFCSDSNYFFKPVKFDSPMLKASCKTSRQFISKPFS
jgi:hypothetical protein